MTAQGNEQELIERAKTDPEAFGLLYEQYVGRIYNYIFYRTGNHQDAEDLTAKVFHRALNHIDSYKHRGHPFSAWLYRIAHNLVANWYRDNKNKESVSLEDMNLPVTDDDNPVQVVAKREQLTVLLDAIRKLPMVRQKLLILKFVEGESNAEIGRILNRSEGAVKALYHRTLQTLRDLLVDNPDILDPSEAIHDD